MAVASTVRVEVRITRAQRLLTLWVGRASAADGHYQLEESRLLMSIGVMIARFHRDESTPVRGRLTRS